MPSRSSALSSTSVSRGCTSLRATVGSRSTRSTRRSSTSGSSRPVVPNPYYRNPIGYGMCGPTVEVWGSDEQKKRYLRPLFTGEEVWCQLFSEPGSGSRLRRPVRQGRARRRRVDRQRAEGLDDAGARQPLGPPRVPHRCRRPEARRAHRVGRRHARAWRRGAAAAPDDRRGRVQRGVLHRRAHPRLRAPRRSGRGVACVAHDADERASVDRRRDRPEGRWCDRRAR